MKRALRILYHVGMALVLLILIFVAAPAPYIVYVILGDEAGQKWAMLIGIGVQFIAAVIADIIGHRKRKIV